MEAEGSETERNPPIRESLRAHAIRYWGSAGAAWLDGLGAKINDACERWQLELAEPFSGSSTAFVARVIRKDASPAVLKIAHPAMVGEAQALRAYGPDVAIEVFEASADAMLLELCTPGVALRDAMAPSVVIDVTLELMATLWRATAPPGIASLGEVCDRLRVLGEGVLRMRDDLDDNEFSEGLALLSELPRTAAHEVLLHGDLHPGNILSASRRPWLVTDPRPLVGDPAYEPMQSIIEVPSETGGPLDAEELATRIDHVAGRLGLPAVRIARWGIARRTDWALFCLSNGDEAGATAARVELAHFKIAADRFAPRH